MGSFIEVNDTLQITTAQGFPADILHLERHQKEVITIDEVRGRIFEFHNKPKARIFHSAPTRCFLVHNIDGKWLYWGHIMIIEQTISGESKETMTTSGKYKIVQIYGPEYQKMITQHESPEGCSYV